MSRVEAIYGKRVRLVDPRGFCFDGETALWSLAGQLFYCAVIQYFADINYHIRLTLTGYDRKQD